MSGRAVRRGSGLVMAAIAAMLVAGCGGKETAASNVVEMRDLEVVDGTANDDMTDLDAVRSNGFGAGANQAANSATPARKAPAAEAGSADAEAVASE